MRRSAGDGLDFYAELAPHMEHPSRHRRAGMTAPVAVVTGAARGIGRAIALALTAAGHDVVLADLDEHGGTSTVTAITDEGGKATFVRTDMSDPAEVEALLGAAVSAYGRLDVLVNNAAVTRVIDLFDVTADDWDQIMAVNARGYFLALQGAARRMRAQGGGGCVINVASVAGKGWRHTTNIAYASSKGAVLTMTRIAAAALGPYGIRVNAVCPGMTRTEMMRGWIRGRAAELGVPEDDLIADMTGQVALGRLVEPAEVAAGVVYLASPAAAAVTGQSLNLDGGLVWD
jgi:NAD(P)-dependent dehydrogenase (short-subunit alcohol dehydrogenase family)